MLPTDLSSFLHQYGYLAVALGAFVEGEAALLVAGILASQEYLYAPYVALAAFCGSFVGDQLVFLLARYKGAALLRHFPRLAAGVEAMSKKVRRHEVPLILGFRFMYGLRTVTLVFLGFGSVRTGLFVPLNALAAAVWAVLFTTIGYYFGHAVTRILGDLGEYRPYAVAGGIALLIAFWLWRRHRRNTKLP